MVNIIVAFPKLENAKRIKALLIRNGAEVTAVCTTAAQVLMTAEDYEDGIVICGYRFMDMFCEELREYLSPEFKMIVIASRNHEINFYGEGLLYIPMPLKAYELFDAVSSMEDAILSKRNRRKKRTAQEMAVIQNAKVLLCQKKEMTEEEAHRYIQKTSMNNGTNLVETAHMILELF